MKLFEEEWINKSQWGNNSKTVKGNLNKEKANSKKY